jgi:hypothetical protein
MHGIIFNAFEEFVLEKASMDVWNQVLDDSAVASGGVYTAGAVYDDSEIVMLATALCDILKLPLNDGLKVFGEFLFVFLLSRGPIKLQGYKNTQRMLLGLESVVYRDVRRVHPDAYTPLFEYTPTSKNCGELTYYSKRNLCIVAEGLLSGAAKHYNQTVSVEHTECMHNDFVRCKWNVTFS